MKKTLLLTVVFTLFATLAFAQAGIIGVFQDVGGLDCNLLDGGVPTNQWHFVHVLSGGVSAVQFKATLPACASAVIFLSDTSPFPVIIGGSQTGVAIAFPTCQTPPVHVLTVVTFGTGVPACCAYPITDDPAAGTGTVNVTDCAFVTGPADGAQAGQINSNATCTCAVPVEESTWGHIKSLYSANE